MYSLMALIAPMLIAELHVHVMTLNFIINKLRVKE